MEGLTRRNLFATALALGASNSLQVLAKPKFGDYPFSLGVAAGDPQPDGIVMWTRLAPKPLDPASMPAANISVKWEIAADEGFSKVIRKGKQAATAALAHSVHVEARGLDSGRWYWYRFEADGERSPIGRFRTAPALGESPARVKFAFASCQQWTEGLWTAYQHLADEDLDLVLHLGDYIYSDNNRPGVRSVSGPARLVTLAHYRERHTLYKTDPALQRVHARFAWMVTWDDNDVTDNYANAVPGREEPGVEFLNRRSAAYQAFYENLPLRRAQIPIGPDMPVYRRADFGRLVRFHMLDTRQYRDDQPCGDGLKKPCAE